MTRDIYIEMLLSELRLIIADEIRVLGHLPRWGIVIIRLIGKIDGSEK